jgi:hypothetical protein
LDSVITSKMKIFPKEDPYQYKDLILGYLQRDIKSILDLGKYKNSTKRCELYIYSLLTEYLSKKCDFIRTLIVIHINLQTFQTYKCRILLANLVISNYL